MLVSWAAWVRSALLFRAVPSHPKWTLSRPPRSVIQSLLAPPPRLRQLRLDHARTKVKVRWSVFQLPWIPFPFRRSVRKRLRWPISSPLAPRPTSLVSAKLLLDPFPACIIRIISSDGYAFGSTGCVSSSCRQRLPSFTHSCSSCRLVPHRRRWASTSRHPPSTRIFNVLPRSLDWHAFLVHFLRACVQVSPRPRFHALVFLPFRQRRRLSSPTCSHLGFPSLFFPPRLLRAFLLLPTHLLRFLRLRNGRAAVGQHRLLCVGSARFRHPNELRRRTLSDRVRKGNSLPIGTETIRWDPPREGKQTRRRGSDPKHPG